ncbi:MAG TPA: beta-N-acetylglucosaminidase domain-containing protein, partial [Candidatus Sumerlaeota bacterium]|nr:beta-N-acetylglucosaminidase domain-containing protein [Candidatus Sumerlaeota bacterium]
EGYVLEVCVENKRPVIILAGAGDAGTWHAAQTLIQMLGQMPRLRPVRIRDWPAFTRERGYGEFFYGRPWSHEERREAIRFMSGLKMNFYMYAPKDDPWHRDRWREDYPTTAIAEMKDLIDLAGERFITFSFAMSPGLSIKYTSEEDFRILMKKYEVLYDLGVRDFSLQLDDLGNATLYDEDTQQFRRPGEAHALMINKVYHALREKDPAITYSACGAMYFIAQPDEYTRTLGDMVDPEIPLMWTGSDVVDSEITIAEVYLYASGIQRPPFVSDNFPVNDFATNRLFMGPLVGRPLNLYKHVYPGFLENPMNQQEASKIPLATVADYAWNPDSYDPERSWDDAIRLVAGDKGYPAMRLFCENNRSSVMEKREAIELNMLIYHWFMSPSEKTAAPLGQYLRRMSTLRRDLVATVDNPALLTEIDPWVAKMELQGRAGLLALEIQMRTGTLEERGNSLRRLFEMVEELRKMKEETGGGVIERLIYRTTVGGAGVEEGRWFPRAWNARDRLPLNPLGSYAIDLALDGRDDTFFLTERSLRAGDVIQISLEEPLTVAGVHLSMKNREHPTDFIYDGILEYSSNLKHWHKVKELDRPEIKATPRKPVAVRAFRIRILKDQPEPLLLREIRMSTCPDDSVTTPDADLQMPPSVKKPF